MSDETATPCAFCDPNNKGWGTKAIYEDTRLDLKKWASRIAGHEVSDSHGLDYIILIQAHLKKVEAERATLAAENRAMGAVIDAYENPSERDENEGGASLVYVTLRWDQLKQARAALAALATPAGEVRP